MAFQNCPASRSTVSFTKCPSTHEEWMAASRRKNCSSISQNCTSPKNFRYHCVSNAFMNETIEVCAPGLFLLGFCPEYNFRGERIQDNYNADCKRYAEPCPNRYESWKSYKFPECVTLKKPKHRSEYLLSNKASNFSLVKEKMKRPEVIETSVDVILWSCLSVSCVVFISICVFLFIYKRKQRIEEKYSKEKRPLNDIESQKRDS
ncbi:uncharacterized protein LOC134240821 isoform X2 [Saccostrea cucullata]|uniref:uncharacterized protein LOC134240821 isoform X2 n=1 Tax=Saccostrea cuccullata TaxID=36930 RepID=UPI002ED67526